MRSYMVRTSSPPNVDRAGWSASKALHPQVGRGYWIAKRTLDIVVSALALLVLGLPLLAIAFSVWIGDRSAPILFRQQRTGLGGRRFSLLKFRTMVANADELKEELREFSEVPWPDFRMSNDPRVTKVGRFLRKTSLDELPQLINVLKGDMTLVGPRPTSFDVDTYDIWHTGRLDFRPGLTGPWQVWGRNSMDFDERCRLEINYFRDPSFFGDLKILLLTARVVFQRTGVA